jgi:hypothetical protein
MPGVAKLSSDSEALALLIEGSDGLAMMRHEGPVQLGIRKTAMVIAALRGIAQTEDTPESVAEEVNYFEQHADRFAAAHKGIVGDAQTPPSKD